MKPIVRTRSAAEVVSLFESRYTAKSYDASRVVSEEDFNAILTAGRLAPSSMGMEPWQFIVATPGELTDEVQPHCWGVHPTPSHWVFLLGRNADAFLPSLRTDVSVDAQVDYVRHMHCDIQGFEAETADARCQAVAKLVEQDLNLDTEESATGWVNRQVYLAMGSMLLAAAMLGVDSTPVEGLNAAAVEEVLVRHGLMDPTQTHFVALLTFGYTDRQEHRDKTRRPESEVVTWA